MTNHDVIGWEQIVFILMLVGSITSISAFAVALFVLRKSYLILSFLRHEDSRNLKSLKFLLDGCQDTINRICSIRDELTYFRSLGALSQTLSNTMSHYDIYISLNARSSVTEISLMLLDASTYDYDDSVAILRAMPAHIDTLLENINFPPSRSRFVA